MKPIKTIKALAKEICKREGKKKQVDIAQVSEILGVLSDIVYDDFYHTLGLLFWNGHRRWKKRKK